MAKARPRSKATAGASSSRSWTDRLDRLFRALDGDVAGTQRGKLIAFETILLMIAAVEPWTRAARAGGRWQYVVPAVIATLLAAFARWGGSRRFAFFGLAALQSTVVAIDFPERGNHAYLEAWFFLLAGILDVEDDDDRTLYLRAVRATVCIIFFYAGVQKLIQGYYIHGQYLAFSVASESFRPILRPLMEAAEYERLVSLTGKLGDGPYLASSPVLLAASNLTWITEIALVPLFVIARTRTLAVCIALLLIAVIEAGAREVFFGLVYTDALMLLLPGDFHRKLVAPFAALLAILLAIRLGILPNATFY